MQALYIPVALLGAYLIGSLSFAVIVSRLMGLDDPRSYGSKNPARPMCCVRATRLRPSSRWHWTRSRVMCPCSWCWSSAHASAWVKPRRALRAWRRFLGHLWPVFFRFQGGKGVATAAGALLAINPWLGAATLLTWLIVAVFFRYSSLASLVSAVFAPFYQALIWGLEPVLLAIIGMSLLLVWRHQANIAKLLAGTESKLGQKATPAPLGPAPFHDKPHAAHGHGPGHAHHGKHKKGHH
jgi:glycerol-3-phosphate acyltransferase PlsY